MNNLIIANEEKLINGLVENHHGEMVTTSLKVAEAFDKKHKNVIQSIENLVAENSAAKIFFVESSYKNRGKRYKMYYVNRDGFSLLGMGFTGARATEFKLAFLKQFNAMEKHLKEQSESLWLMKMTKSYTEFLEFAAETRKEISEIKNDKQINRAQRLNLKTQVKIHIHRKYHQLNGSISKPKLYSRFWSSFKQYFEIDVIEELPSNKYEQAIDYVIGSYKTGNIEDQQKLDI